MSLREDNGPYCLLWLGMLLLGAYYTNFAYRIWTDATAAGAFFGNFGFMLGLIFLPLLMVFFFTGYLRPTRGKAKQSAFGFSVFLALIFVILAYTVSLNPDVVLVLGETIVFSAWGIGSAILVAGGFAIVQSSEQSTSPGMLDVSSLHYGPPKDEEVEEPEPEPVVETPVESESAEPVEKPAEPEADSDESKPIEPESE